MTNSNLVAVEQYLESGIQIGTKYKTKDMSEYIHKVNPQNGVAILDIQILFLADPTYQLEFYH